MSKTSGIPRDSKLKAVLAEYNDCREEIKIRIQQRTRMTQFYIVGVSAIAGLAIQSGNFFVMLVAPAYAIFIYAMFADTYFYTDSLAHYIMEEIELKKIPKILGPVPKMDFKGTEKNKTPYEWQTHWLGWETNYSEVLSKEHPLSRKKILHLFTWGVIIVSSFSIAYGLLLLESSLYRLIVIPLVTLIVYGVLHEWIARLTYKGIRPCMEKTNDDPKT